MKPLNPLQPLKLLRENNIKIKSFNDNVIEVYTHVDKAKIILEKYYNIDIDKNKIILNPLVKPLKETTLAGDISTYTPPLEIKDKEPKKENKLKRKITNIRQHINSVFKRFKDE